MQNSFKYATIRMSVEDELVALECCKKLDILNANSVTKPKPRHLPIS